MDRERSGIDDTREFRLEGLGLVVIGGVLIAALLGSFFLGRWYERQTAPVQHASVGQEDPLEHVVASSEPADVDASATVFDTVDAGAGEAEPQRQTAPAGGAAPRDPSPAPAEPPPAVRAGDYWVQVFAGRDRRSAEGQYEALKSAGFAVRLFAEKEGEGSLFKVRVGGFASRGEADAAAQQLQQRGFAGAWVTKL
jgi:cell division septation protein DedD